MAGKGGGGAGGGGRVGETFLNLFKYRETRSTDYNLLRYASTRAYRHPVVMNVL